MLTALSLALKARPLLVIIPVAVLAIGILAYFYVTTDKTLGVRTIERDTARNALSKSEKHVYNLQGDSVRLVNAFLRTDNERLKRINEAEEAKETAAIAAAGLDAAKRQNLIQVQGMTAVQKKQAADIGVMREQLGRLPTTVQNDTVNTIVTILTARIAIQDTTIKQVTKANGLLTAENNTLRGENRQLRDDKSALEVALNDRDNATADYLERIQKPLLNIGYGKKIKQATGEIRAGRVPLRKR